MGKFSYTVNFDKDERLTEEEESKLIEFVTQFGDEVVINWFDNSEWCGIGCRKENQ